MRTNGFVAVGITHNKFVISIYLLSLIENVKMNAWIMFYVQTSIYEQVIKVLARQIYIYIYIFCLDVLSHIISTTLTCSKHTTC